MTIIHFDESIGDNTLRALSTALGSQIMILRFPPERTLPWCSNDELAAVSTDNGEVVVHTSGPLPVRTAMELAAAIGSASADLLAEGPT